MCTLEMQNMDGIIPRVVQVNKLAESWKLPRPQNHQTHRYVKFFEVDVKQMFPRLRRGNPSATLHTVKSCKTKDVVVWEAVLLIVNWVAEAKHIRMKASGMWFGIHEQKHLDVIRKAYGDQYTNIPWHQVEAYLRFGLFANDCFVLGSRVMRQLLGVAIGECYPPNSPQCTAWPVNTCGHNTIISRYHGPTPALRQDPWV